MTQINFEEWHHRTCVAAFMVANQPMSITDLRRATAYDHVPDSTIMVFVGNHIRAGNIREVATNHFAMTESGARYFRAVMDGVQEYKNY